MPSKFVLQLALLITTPIVSSAAGAHYSVPQIGALELKDPASYSAQELFILNLTLLLDRSANYVEKNPIDQWYAPWLTTDAPARSKRTLASFYEIDEGEGGSQTTPPSGYSEGSSSEEVDWAWKTRVYNQNRSPNHNNQGFHSHPVGQEGSTSQGGSSRTLTPDIVPLAASEGYRYYQNLVIRCPLDNSIGDLCVVVGGREQFSILEDATTSHLDSTLIDPIQNTPVPYSTPSAANNTDDELAGSRPTVVPRGVAPTETTGPTPSEAEQRKLSDSVSRCEASYQKALRLCGSDQRRPDRDYVLGKLNLVAPNQYANYLTYVRELNTSSGDLARVCRAKMEVANSMVSLNVYYETLCKGAKTLCTSECFHSRAQSQGMDSQIHTLSDERARSCEHRMERYAASGIFQPAEATELMAEARDCQKTLARLGPCKEVKDWDSAQCQQHCQDPLNSTLSACVSLKAASSNCQNPEFAERTPYCKKLKVPNELAGSYPPGSKKPGSGNLHRPPAKSSPAGLFGMERAEGARAETKSYQQQTSQPQGNRTRVYYIAGDKNSKSQGRSGAQTEGKKQAQPKTTMIDGLLNFLGFVRPRGNDHSKKGAGRFHAQHQRRYLTSESQPSGFDINKYIFTVEIGADGKKRCFRGEEILLCPEQDIFRAISQRYRKISPQMKN